MYIIYVVNASNVERGEVWAVWKENQRRGWFSFIQRTFSSSFLPTPSSPMDCNSWGNFTEGDWTLRPIDQMRFVGFYFPLWSS